MAFVKAFSTVFETRIMIRYKIYGEDIQKIKTVIQPLIGMFASTGPSLSHVGRHQMKSVGARYKTKKRRGLLKAEVAELWMSCHGISWIFMG